MPLWDVKRSRGGPAVSMRVKPDGVLAVDPADKYGTLPSVVAFIKETKPNLRDTEDL